MTDTKKEEIKYLKLKIKYLEEKLCGGKHRMKYLRSDVHKEIIPILTRTENGKMQVIGWHDITDVYACDKCGVLEYRLRKLPSGYFRVR